MADLEDPKVFEKYSMANSALDMHVDNFINLVEGILIRFLELIGASVIIITLHPVIILVVMFFTFLLSFIQKKRLNTEREFDEGAVEERRKYSYLYDTVNDFKYGKEIRTYGIKKNIIGRVESINKSIYIKYKQSRKKSSIYQIGYHSLVFLQQAGIYGYLVLSFALQAISVGNFLLYLGSIDRFKEALTSIGDVAVQMNYMGIRIYDIQNFMSIESKLQSTKKENVGIDTCSGYDIRFENVGFHYPNSEAMVLKNVSITIPQGERLTIVGENGAGKSTFVKLLLRIYDPTEGDIYLGGVNIKDIPLEEYHSILATVFQDYKVLSFTVKENIAFGDASAADDRNIFHILDSLNMGAKIRSLAKGLDTYLNNDFEEDGVQMSGGEIQKLAIARAIYRNAPIFIMDEPTSALDAISEMEIYELVYKMTENRTCIFISHRMSTARLADKIAFFDHGCITEYGTYEELMQDKGSFYNMFYMQAKYYIMNEKSV